MAVTATNVAARRTFGRLVYTIADDAAGAAAATIDPNGDALAGSWLDALLETDTAAGDAAALAVMEQLEVHTVLRIGVLTGGIPPVLVIAATNNAGRTRLTVTALIRGANTWDLIIQRLPSTAT